ncbi:MAG: hypothetical protein R2880_18440 [Deinococcales bacterium]
MKSIQEKVREKPFLYFICITMLLAFALTACRSSTTRVAPCEDCDITINDQDYLPAKAAHPVVYGGIGRGIQKEVQSVAPLQRLSGQVALSALSTSAASSNAPIELRMLIISAGLNDYGLEALESLMKQVGVPYDVLDASQKDLSLMATAGQHHLINADGSGRYQGIFLAEGSLSYFDGTGYVSAFDDHEWNLLWQYERDYGIRQVSLYSFPGTFPEDFGLSYVSAVSTDTSPLNISLTPDGQSVFKSLKSTATIPIRYAYTYLANLSSSEASAKSLLKDGSGRTVAVLGTSSDGRERINLTMGHNPYLLHSQLLGYDLLVWVSRGVFIGERRMYLNIDVDDWYLASDIWNPASNSNWPEDERSFRLRGSDALSARSQVLNLRRLYPLASNFSYAIAFNASQANVNAALRCRSNASLESVTLCINGSFDWISHTYTHAEMDFLDYASSRYEMDQNSNFANHVGLSYNAQTLVTGKHSGLGWFRIADGQARGLSCQYDQVPSDEYCQFGLLNSNIEMLRAAADAGIRYLAANRGWYSHTAACDSCGIVHPLDQRIFLVPRWPTNIFYNAGTPAQNVSEFNYFYGPNGIIRDGNGNPFFSSNLSYAQMLNYEAETALYHILTFSPYPHFFHQQNLRQYTSGKSLLYDWSSAVLRLYSSYFNLPVLNLKWLDTAKLTEERTSFFNAGAKGVWNRQNNTVALSSSQGGMIFTTGMSLNGATSWLYGATRSSKVNIAANTTLSGIALAQ